ncbi:MAG TPA: PASTA domain-containing protein, partial [Actinomycetales bacterium]|nr:PASTA domain-containing protein [Actinomycetales bacterium]
ELTISGAGLSVLIRTEESEEVEPGHVISTDPAAGESVREGQSVTLVIATEPETVEVEIPDVVGEQRGAAEAKLRNLDLVVQNQTETSDQPEGTVLRTDPPAGTSVEVGSTVTLIVSSGPSVEPTPDPTPPPDPTPDPTPTTRPPDPPGPGDEDPEDPPDDGSNG